MFKGLLAPASVVVLLALGFAGVPADVMAQTTWYVSPAGSDSNPGSQTQPFKTIQRAADGVSPGDTVIVEDGVYTGTGAGTACASSTERPIVCLTRGGSSGALVTFKSRNRGGAKLDGKSNTSTSGFRFRSNANYIRIEGFEIYGIGSSTNGASAIQLYSGGHDSEIVGNLVHDIGRLCADHIYGMNGIFVQQPRVLIEGNTIRDVGRFAPGENGCSPTTTNYQNHDHGIYVNGNSDSSAPGAGNIQISNNIFSNVKRGWPIQVYPGTVSSLSILNNTFAYANPYRNGHIIVAASTSNMTVANNIFYEPTSAAINFSSGTHSNMTVSNNLSSRAMATSKPSAVLFSNNWESTNPQFASTDFLLSDGSPAVDWGLSLSEVTSDIAGRARPQRVGYDLGARELPDTSSGGSTEPPPPTPPADAADTLAPTVAITSPAENATVWRWVTIAATASDTVSVVSVTFYVDGTALSTDTSAPYSASWNARKASRGAHVLTAVARDAAGNSASASVTVNR